jgi:hypothetical protein
MPQPTNFIPGTGLRHPIWRYFRWQGGDDMQYSVVATRESGPPRHFRCETPAGGMARTAKEKLSWPAKEL